MGIFLCTSLTLGNNVAADMSEVAGTAMPPKKDLGLRADYYFGLLASGSFLPLSIFKYYSLVCGDILNRFTREETLA